MPPTFYYCHFPLIWLKSSPSFWNELPSYSPLRISIWHRWQRRTFLFSRRKSFRNMILKNIWKNYGNFFEEEWRLYNHRILKIETTTTKNSKDFAIFYTFSNKHGLYVIWSLAHWLNVNALMLFYIRLPKPLLWLQLPSEGKQAELPCAINSLGCLCWKGKYPKWTPQLSSTITKENAYEDYKIIILKFEQEALLSQMFLWVFRQESSMDAKIMD